VCREIKPQVLSERRRLHYQQELALIIANAPETLFAYYVLLIHSDQHHMKSSKLAVSLVTNTRQLRATRITLRFVLASW
jgi:hypothetical protein